MQNNEDLESCYWSESEQDCEINLLSCKWSGSDASCDPIDVTMCVLTMPKHLCIAEQSNRELSDCRLSVLLMTTRALLSHCVSALAICCRKV